MALFSSSSASNIRAPQLNLDGYNFAINKMHFIAAKYPLKSEAYLRNTHAPDLHEYLTWKDVGMTALAKKLSVRQTLDEFKQQCNKTLQFSRPPQHLVSRSLSEATKIVRADSPELGAARILNSMHFRSMSMNGVIKVNTDPRPSLGQPAIDLTRSPIFPRPDDLAIPEGEDAFLLNPVLEDAQRRWVKGVHKEDHIREIVKPDADGYRVWIKKTYYVVDGEEFHDIDPRTKRGSRFSVKRRSLKIDTGSPGPLATSRSFSSLPEKDARSLKRPLDSAIALDESFENPTSKRIQLDLDDDIPLSSLSRPGELLDSRSRSSSMTRDLNLRSQEIWPAGIAEGPGAALKLRPEPGFDGLINLRTPDLKITPTHGHRHATGALPTSGSVRSGPRRGRPAPIAIPGPSPPRQDLLSSPSPRKPATKLRKQAPSTPLQSSPNMGTPHRNKYVPTTPNPLRWTPAELYHLNALARKGLHPRELHPLMMKQFPDKPRSIHAIKDRRDKMSRAKELQGKVPNYQAKYGDV